ncbi:MAG: hypothetical protein LWX56_10005 [Ignavibacteria bacterium]|nr:hypothetical protein [Ignavibacteria bacterium]
MKNFVFSTVIILAIAVSATFAQTRTPGVNQTQAKQEQRIHQGVRSGELTPREARALQQEQRTIERTKLMVKADGKVTKAERRMIKAEQKQASKDIWRLKHNRPRIVR